MGGARNLKLKNGGQEPGHWGQEYFCLWEKMSTFIFSYVQQKDVTGSRGAGCEAGS